MSLADEIRGNAQAAYKEAWSVRNGTVVPSASDLRMANDAVAFDAATVLYADLDASTSLVENSDWRFAGEIYKTFLYAASRLIRNHGGSIVSYDGDRVMGVFISDLQRNNAVSCALCLHWVVKNILQPELQNVWKNTYQIKHVVGIDQSEIRAARTGVRGDNDLVWIGNAANLAAKLTSLPADTPTWITQRVRDGLLDPQKTGSQGENIWKNWTWAQHNGDPIYSTSYWRSVK